MSNSKVIAIYIIATAGSEMKDVQQANALQG